MDPPRKLSIKPQDQLYMAMTDMLSRLKPAMPRSALILFSGLMWSLVGLMLCRLAIGWYLLEGILDQLGFLLAGTLLAFAIHLYGFSKIARKNIARIGKLNEKPCIFAFMAWWNYPLVLFMIGLGLTLRHSPFPKIYLGVLYIGIGGALLLSSLLYYNSFPQRTVES
jgi:hypothetical protein